MTKILPTVGRVVLFTPSRLTGDGRFSHMDGRKPLAAIVAHVFNDGLVKRLDAELALASRKRRSRWSGCGAIQSRRSSPCISVLEYGQTWLRSSPADKCDSYRGGGGSTFSPS